MDFNSDDIEFGKSTPKIETTVLNSDVTFTLEDTAKIMKKLDSKFKYATSATSSLINAGIKDCG